MTPEMQKKPRKRVRKEMLINAIPPEEVRIAILEDGVLEELYVERSTHESFVGNIYKGKIVNIEPSIQAAFVDFGIGRNGFLHVSDVASAYCKSPGDRGDRRDERDPRAFVPVEIPSEPAMDFVPPEFEEEVPMAQVANEESAQEDTVQED